MPYLTKADLITHVYPEIIDVITRTNDAIVDKAISSGVSEMRGYLNRFDLLAIFGDDTTDPTYANEYLNTLAKDIICWRLIILSNPNVNVEIFRLAYQDAIKTLTKIADGKNIDPGWPLRTDVPTDIPGETTLGSIGGENINNGIDLSGHVSWNSNKRRHSHW